MKLKYAALLLVSLLLASCYKYITVNNGIQYVTGGFSDVTLDQNDSAQMYVYCELVSGDPANEYVTLKMSGLPANVVADTDSITFRPNYSFRLALYAHNPQPGVYPITVTTTSPTLGTKTYTFRLTVTSLTDCTPQLLSPQAGSSFYGHVAQVAGHSGTSFASISRTGCDTLRIEVDEDSLVAGDPDPELYPVVICTAVVNCASNSLTIYPQGTQLYTGNAMIRGSGTYVPVTDTTATTTIQDTIYSGSQIVAVNVITIY